MDKYGVKLLYYEVNLKGGESVKKVISLLIVLILCLSCLTMAAAARKSVVKDQYYIGAMRVVNCRDYVSLRDAPDKKATVLAKVPLNAIVLYCNNNVRKYAPGKYKKQADLFIRCEYDGMEGYIMKKYLQPAPEFEPAETKQYNEEMTMEEIAAKGEIILDWNEFNVSVLASREQVTEDGATWEYVRVGCFINDMPNWGYTEAVKLNGKPVTLKAFMGGTEDEPAVYIYDEEYGLTMLDLMDGTELWTILKEDCSLGDAAVTAIGEENGTLYVAGTDGPHPVAVSSEGTILWRSDVDDPEVYEPTKITLNTNEIEVIYDSGKIVLLEYNGELISVSDI